MGTIERHVERNSMYVHGKEVEISSEKLEGVLVSTLSPSRRMKEKIMNLIQTNLKVFIVLFLISGLINAVPFTVNAEESLSLASQQEVSQDDLKTFAEAYAQVSQVYNVYENRIIKSKEPGQATALQQEANQKMNQAVRNHGLSIEDYNSIHRMIEKDPSLKQQLTQLLIENP
jgi:hypothetical protein